MYYFLVTFWSDLSFLNPNDTPSFQNLCSLTQQDDCRALQTSQWWRREDMWTPLGDAAMTWAHAVSSHPEEAMEGSPQEAPRSTRGDPT